MSRIRFLSNQIYDTGAPGKGPKFAQGLVLDQSDVGKALGVEVTPEYAEQFLDRWVRRNVAEYVDNRTKPTPDDIDVDEQISAAPENESEQTDDDVDLHTLTRAELDALAAERDVDVSDARNKGDVIAALELASEQ